jgi:prepilin-type N-terminal cleavage/methylation domain-containing protein
MIARVNTQRLYQHISRDGNKMNNIKEKGFTLLEILVVIGIIGIITGITSDIFIQIIKASNKANIVTEIKQNGDAVLNQLDRLVRNADSIAFFGKRAYGALSFSAFSLTSTQSCTNTTGATRDATFDVCTFITKNPQPQSGYTRIDFRLENEEECASSSLFTTNDKVVNGAVTTCNGNIQIALGTDSDLADLELGTPSTVVPQLLTNTEKQSGVSVTDFTIEVIPTTGKPTLVRFGYTLAQGIAATSRVDSKATVDFETTVSLRTY